MNIKNSTVFLTLGLFVLALIIISSISDSVGYLGKGPDKQIPSYDESYLIFPPNTIDWKIISDRHSVNDSIFYCLMNDGRWHKCNPAVGGNK